MADATETETETAAPAAAESPCVVTFFTPHAHLVDAVRWTPIDPRSDPHTGRLEVRPALVLGSTNEPMAQRILDIKHQNAATGEVQGYYILATPAGLRLVNARPRRRRP